jgi:hypothetical protein
MRIDTLMRQCGSRQYRLRDFKNRVEVVLSDFKEKGRIDDFSFVAGSEVKLIRIAKKPTPSQRRWLERRSRHG